MEVEVTWNRVIRIWWSYAWRNLIAIIISMIVGGVFGFVIGAIMGALGFSVDTIKLVVTPISFLIGLAISIVPMKMIIGKSFGSFRLVLVNND